jgi:hypothetical protein
MLDRRSEDLPRLVQIVARIQHMVDVGPILGPLLDLVEVEMVRDDRIVSLVVDWCVPTPVGSYFGGRSGMSSFLTLR